VCGSGWSRKKGRKTVVVWSFTGMTTSGTRVQLEEHITVNTHKTKYDLVAHNDVKPGSAIL